MAYSDKVVDHYNNPRNVGTLDKSSAEVGTGLVGAPECGDVMRLQIRVNPETQVIEEASSRPSAAARRLPALRWPPSGSRAVRSRMRWRSRTPTS
jgi:NifU-like N terminal domain